MTHQEFLEQLRSSPRPVVVEAWASWCAPCRQMAPSLQTVSQDFAGRVDLLKLDVGNEPALARGLGVMGVPTMIVYQGGKELARRVGAQPEAQIRELFAAAESGQAPVRSGLPTGERMLRLGTALALAAAGWVTGPSLLILAVAFLVFFSAVYDRCPIWRAVAPWLAGLLQGKRARTGSQTG